ncbi:unnamed protein product [Cyclocybe aegerita]|uniref:Microbial-type PARG catalytic domain-containing protein n=1 Tax=Cyclocybe aegerita TaxID=1973307 RepID=A0A8S0XGR4_CYCAE|nr:unnamed protein product [Cyclocybe aegerita]
MTACTLPYIALRNGMHHTFKYSTIQQWAQASPPHTSGAALESRIKGQRQSMDPLVPVVPLVVGASLGVIAVVGHSTGPHQQSRPQRPQSSQSRPTFPYVSIPHIPPAIPSTSVPTRRTTMAAIKYGGRYAEGRRSELRKIGEETLYAIDQGICSYRGVDYPLKDRVKDLKKNTKFYGHDSSIVKGWAAAKSAAPKSRADAPPTQISVLHISTLKAARLLDNAYQNFPADPVANRTGVLNFASATKPGGGFKNGADAQEESLARSSTLFCSLSTSEAEKFYDLHKRESAANAAAYYSHAMIYSPKTTFFRDDDGQWLHPFDIDVLSCAAVNAGEVRKGQTTGGSTATAPTAGTGNVTEIGIEKEMSERMGRILYVFEREGVRNLVLGTFGTGVFRNSISTVARIWAHLLLTPDARYKDSFDRIIFAITGEDTFVEFQTAFDAWGQKRAPGLGGGGNSGKFW